MARHDTAAIRQPRAKTRPAHAQGHATARAQGLASGVCRDTILCNVTGGAGLESRYKAPGAATRAAARATWRSVRTRQGLVLRYKLCIVTGGGRRCDMVGPNAATRRASARVLEATQQDMPATRPRGGHDTTQYTATTRRCVRGLDSVRVQRACSLGHGCVHCALDPILTQCTVLSHYWITVHDHCSRGFQKFFLIK